MTHGPPTLGGVPGSRRRTRRPSVGQPTLEFHVPTNQVLRIGFLGVTHPHAAAWARAAIDHAGVELTGIYDPDPEAAKTFADQFDAPPATDSAEVSANADAIVVDGRNDQAHDLSTRALAAGLPVLIEKTGGMNAAELADIAAEANRRELPTQLGYFLRYSPAVARARAVLRSGELGRVSLARFHAAIPDKAWTSMGAWFGDPTNVVGPFTEAGCHLIDIVRELLGEPSSVTALTTDWQTPPNHAEDALGAVLLIDGIVTVVDFTAHEANPWNSNWGIELYGTKQTFKAGLTPSWTALNDGSTHTWAVEPAGHHAADDDEHRRRVAEENAGFMAQGMAAFVDALRTGAPTPVDAASGAATLELIERILRTTR